MQTVCRKFVGKVGRRAVANQAKLYGKGTQWLEKASSKVSVDIGRDKNGTQKRALIGLAGGAL